LQGASKAHDFANNLSRGPREYLVAVRSEGQFIGEMALFAVAAVRCASVRAKGPVRVKIVPGESLEELIDMAPEVCLKQTFANYSFCLSKPIFLSFQFFLSETVVSFSFFLN
jgi:hypothetical protein